MLHNLKYPIIQAPMAGGYTTVDLITAVSIAEALGSLGAEYLSLEVLRKTIREIKAKTSNPFNVNLFTTKTPKLRPLRKVSKTA